MDEQELTLDSPPSVKGHSASRIVSRDNLRETAVGDGQGDDNLRETPGGDGQGDDNRRDTEIADSLVDSPKPVRKKFGETVQKFSIGNSVKDRIAALQRAAADVQKTPSTSRNSLQTEGRISAGNFLPGRLLPMGGGTGSKTGSNVLSITTGSNYIPARVTGNNNISATNNTMTRNVTNVSTNNTMTIGGFHGYNVNSCGGFQGNNNIERTTSSNSVTKTPGIPPPPPAPPPAASPEVLAAQNSSLQVGFPMRGPMMCGNQDIIGTQGNLILNGRPSKKFDVKKKLDLHLDRRLTREMHQALLALEEDRKLIIQKYADVISDNARRTSGTNSKTAFKNNLRKSDNLQSVDAINPKSNAKTHSKHIKRKHIKKSPMEENDQHSTSEWSSSSGVEENHLHQLLQLNYAEDHPSYDPSRIYDPTRAYGKYRSRRNRAGTGDSSRYTGSKDGSGGIGEKVGEHNPYSIGNFQASTNVSGSKSKSAVKFCLVTIIVLLVLMICSLLVWERRKPLWKFLVKNLHKGVEALNSTMGSWNQNLGNWNLASSDLTNGDLSNPDLLDSDSEFTNLSASTSQTNTGKTGPPLWEVTELGFTGGTRKITGKGRSDSKAPSGTLPHSSDTKCNTFEPFGEQETPFTAASIHSSPFSQQGPSPAPHPSAVDLTIESGSIVSGVITTDKTNTRGFLEASKQGRGTLTPEAHLSTGDKRMSTALNESGGRCGRISRSRWTISDGPARQLIDRTTRSRKSCSRRTRQDDSVSSERTVAPERGRNSSDPFRDPRSAAERYVDHSLQARGLNRGTSGGITAGKVSEGRATGTLKSPGQAIEINLHVTSNKSKGSNTPKLRRKFDYPGKTASVDDSSNEGVDYDLYVPEETRQFVSDLSELLEYSDEPLPELGGLQLLTGNPHYPAVETALLDNHMILELVASRGTLSDRLVRVVKMQHRLKNPLKDDTRFRTSVKEIPRVAIDGIDGKSRVYNLNRTCLAFNTEQSSMPSNMPLGSVPLSDLSHPGVFRNAFDASRDNPPLPSPFCARTASRQFPFDPLSRSTDVDITSSPSYRGVGSTAHFATPGPNQASGSLSGDFPFH